jgi:hypothetical protein
LVSFAIVISSLVVFSFAIVPFLRACVLPATAVVAVNIMTVTSVAEESQAMIGGNVGDSFGGECTGTRCAQDWPARSK